MKFNAHDEYAHSFLKVDSLIHRLREADLSLKNPVALIPSAFGPYREQQRIEKLPDGQTIQTQVLRQHCHGYEFPQILAKPCLLHLSFSYFSCSLLSYYLLFVILLIPLAFVMVLKDSVVFNCPFIFSDISSSVTAPDSCRSNSDSSNAGDTEFVLFVDMH
jgi:hypothetical protein